MEEQLVSEHGLMQNGDLADIQVAVIETRELPFSEVEVLLRELQRSDQPVFINLPVQPEEGSVFTSPEDFDHLLRLGFPCIRGFIAPASRMDFVAEQAARIGVECYSSEMLQFDNAYTRDSPAENYVYPAVGSGLAYRDGEGGSTAIPIKLIIVAISIGLLTLLVVPLVSDPTPVLHLTLASSAQPPSAGKQIGEMSFLDSGLVDPTTTVLGSMDQLTITIPVGSLSAPAAGMEDAVWLLPDVMDRTTSPLFLGTFQHEQKTLTYASPMRQNLLLYYSRLLIAVQPAHANTAMLPQNPKMWQAQGAFPVIPADDENRFTLLDHLRHLLAADPTLQDNHLPGGLVQWMARNLNKVEEWSSAAQGDWRSQMTENDRVLVDRLLIRMLDYLSGSRFVEMDVPTGTPLLVSPPDSAAIGLINRLPNQAPEGLLQHISLHLSGVATAPGHTRAQALQASQIAAVIEQMVKDLQVVRQDAALLLKMNTQQLRQPIALKLLDEIKLLTATDESGWFDVSLNANVGGMAWINSMTEQLAVLPITRF